MDNSLRDRDKKERPTSCCESNPGLILPKHIIKRKSQEGCHRKEPIPPGEQFSTEKLKKNVSLSNTLDQAEENPAELEGKSSGPLESQRKNKREVENHGEKRQEPRATLKQ